MGGKRVNRLWLVCWQKGFDLWPTDRKYSYPHLTLTIQLELTLTEYNKYILLVHVYLYVSHSVDNGCTYMYMYTAAQLTFMT